MTLYSSKKPPVDLTRFWKRACAFCGAVAGQPCFTRTGKPVNDLGQIHYSRIDRRRVKRPDEYQRRHPQAASGR